MKKLEPPWRWRAKTWLIVVPLLLIGWIVLSMMSERTRNLFTRVNQSIVMEEKAEQMMPMERQLTSGGGAMPSEEGGQSEAGAGGVTLVGMEMAQPDRYLIKNASLTIETEDVKKASEQIGSKVRAVEGYIANVHESVDSLGRRSAEIQVRVPAKRFEKVMKEIEALGKVLDKQVSSEDVTEEFVDTEARLRNLKRTEDRLLQHLNRTGKLNEVVLVEREINRVREEIERLEGRLRFLAHRVAFSTITVTLQEQPKTRTLVPPETFSTGKVVSDATRALVAFGQRLWAVLIWLGIWAVVWAPLGLIAWLAYRRWQRKQVAQL